MSGNDPVRPIHDEIVTSLQRMKTLPQAPGCDGDGRPELADPPGAAVVVPDGRSNPQGIGRLGGVEVEAGTGRRRSSAWSV